MIFNFLRCFLLLLIVSSGMVACQNSPENESEGGSDQIITQVPNTPEELLAAVSKSGENKVMKNQLQGFWRSLNYPGNSLDLGGDMRFTLVDGDIRETGKWGTPADCTLCNLTSTDICFYLSKGEGNVCHTVVRLDSDTLQYFVVGSGTMLSFVREKK